MVSLLSLALPLSPRAVKALNTFSRRSRRVESLQERLHEGARQRHDRLAGHVALLGRGFGRGDEAVRQAVAIGLAEFHEPVLLVAEQMVAEGGAEMGQPLVDLGHPRLGGFVEPGAGAVEAGIGALQQPQLLAAEPERGPVVVQQRDAAEQHRVHHDRIPVPRHPQRHFRVDLEQLRVGVRRHQVIEHRRHPGEQLAGALQRRNGVGEIRHRGIVLDRDDLGGVIGEGLLEGREEVFRRDFGEWRGLKRRLPGLQQRVGLGLRSGRPFPRFPASQFPVFWSRMNGATYITRWGFFGPFTLDSGGLFIEIAPATGPWTMNAQPSPTASRQIIWPSVITVVSAAILIGAEVFGAELPATGAGDPVRLDATARTSCGGAAARSASSSWWRSSRAAQRVEPFTRRA